MCLQTTAPQTAPRAMPDAPPIARTKIYWMVQNSPPPKPLCFDTLRDWQEYLLYVHASGTPITRRQDLGKWAGRRTVTTVFARVDYCADCDIGGKVQQAKQRAGRCILPAGQLDNTSNTTKG